MARRKRSDATIKSASNRGVVPPPPTPEEMEERRQFVDNLVRAGGTPDQIATLARRQFGIDRRTVERLLVDLRKLMREELEASDSKVEQLYRLRNDLLKMRTLPKQPYASIVATEKLVAEIEGNLAPRKLQHDFKGAVPDALAAALAGMTAEDLEALANEQLELEKKAAAIVTTAEPAASSSA